MKVLLDECIPVRLKQYLNDYDVSTVVEAGWSGQIHPKIILQSVLESRNH
jgi:predicted nuclease of predicted toxin-antitoxin system